jgi:hypothetical protein
MNSVNQLLQSLGDDLMKVIVLCIVGVALALFVLARFMISRARERTRRELAAYVAEGTMTADEAERLLNAGKPSCVCAAARPPRVRVSAKPIDDPEPLFEAVPTRSGRP